MLECKQPSSRSAQVPRVQGNLELLPAAHTWMIGRLKVCLVMGLIGLIMACYGDLYGILTGLTKSTDHPSTVDVETLHDLI